MERLLVNVLGSPIFDPVKININFEDTKDIDSYNEECVMRLLHDVSILFFFFLVIFINKRGFEG